MTSQPLRVLTFLALLTVCLVPAVQAQPGVDDHMGRWTFDDAAGSILRDVGPSGFSGQILGGAWEPGIAGSALRLDGTSDYVNVTDSNGYPDAIGA